MTVALALVAGLVAAVVLERTTREVFAHPVLQRTNYRGRALPTASGLIVVVAVIAVEGVRTVAELLGASDGVTARDRLIVLATVVGFGALGLIDDLLGDDRDKGLAGHVRAAARGRVTTGFIKLGGGASISLVVAAALLGDQPLRVVVDAALIALAANLGNLFDRAPGRTIKVGVLVYVPLAVVAGTSATGLALAVVVGAALGLLPADLGERSMLGDTGANALGAALGVATVLTASTGARTVVAGVLLALTLLSEVVSFSRVIAAVAPLRALDHLGRVAAVAVLVALVVVGAPSSAHAEATRPGRVLVVSVPGLTWADLRDHDLPALEAFADDAALADLAPRSVVARSGPGDAYLTISGGSRATTAPGVDGQVLGVDERSSGSAAGDIFQRRTGEPPAGPYVSLTWPTLERVNGRQPYETELGSLTEALADARVGASAIANADGRDSIGESYERQAGLALADRSGVVPGGALGKDLLQDSPASPFGVRLDPSEVADRFETAWSAAAPSDSSKGGVVLVEASDLARTIRYRAVVDADRYDEMWAASLRQTDELVGRLLAQVDPDRDTVLLVAPYNQPGDRDLTAVALRGPDTEPGYLRSVSTQRPGFLTLTDIAPTILDQLGIDRPTAMEGRPATVVASTAPGPDRIQHLIGLNEASRFREQLLTPTTTLIVGLFAGVVALAIAAHANGWGRRPRAAIWAAALVDLALLPASYLIRLFELERRGAPFAWVALAVFALVIAGGATLVGRRFGTRRGALVGVLAVMALVLAGDVVSGSHLSLGAAFGYSPTGNSRLYGISNYSFGQLAAATCLVAAWVADVRPGRQGRALSIVVMGITVVVLGVPIWGSDVGGVLAFTPATLVFAVMITGRRLRLRTAAAGVAGTVVAIALFGALDLARAPGNRGHLGRLFERIGDEGLHPVVAMVERKLVANLEVSTSSLWVLAIPIAAGLWAFLRWYPDRPGQQITARFAALHAGLAAALVAAVLGSMLNDSGAIIGGVMALVVGAAQVALLLTAPAPPRSEPVRADPGHSR